MDLDQYQKRLPGNKLFGQQLYSSLIILVTSYKLFGKTAGSSVSKGLDELYVHKSKDREGEGKNKIFLRQRY